MRLLRSAILLAIAFLGSFAFALLSCNRSGPGIRMDVPLHYHLWVNVLPYDILAEAPVEVHLDINISGILPNSGQIDWGDGTAPEVLKDGYSDTSYYYVGERAHTYLEAGTYTISVGGTGKDGRLMHESVRIRVGRVVRPYTDPISGETYDIVDGVAIVCFAEWERLSNLEGPMADDPAVRQFLYAEGLRVYDEWPTIASMVVVLPGDTTVEEAVAEWPERYPELISSVEPNSVSEPM